MGTSTAERAGPQEAPAADERSYLIAQHRVAERAMLRFVIPTAGALYVGSAIAKPSWQTWCLGAGVIVMSAIWLAAFRQSAKGNLERAVLWVSLAGFGFGTEVVFLRSGSALSIVVVFAALMAYVSLYAHRYLALATAFTATSMVGSELVHHFGLLPAYTLSPTASLAVRCFFVLVFLPLTAFFLRRTQVINAKLRERGEETRLRQQAALVAIGAVQPEIETAVASMKDVSETLAAQAAQQASTSGQVAAATGQLAHLSSETAGAASDAREIAHLTERESRDGAERLKQVETGFRESVGLVEAVRADIRGLSERIEQTEAINRAINDIAENLKFLAVNASLEAARAGEHGKGFSVVATELKRMIDQTSGDLHRSRKLLAEIREQAEVIDQRAQGSTERLQRSFADLGAAGALVNSIGESFARAAERVDTIASAAVQQQKGVTEVSVAMKQLDQAASRMTPAASSLADGARRIARAQEQLRRVLDRS